LRVKQGLSFVRIESLRRESELTPLYLAIAIDQ
jgi:hypothetical protein